MSKNDFILFLILLLSKIKIIEIENFFMKSDHRHNSLPFSILKWVYHHSSLPLIFQKEMLAHKSCRLSSTIRKKSQHIFILSLSIPHVHTFSFLDDEKFIHTYCCLIVTRKFCNIYSCSQILSHDICLI